MNIFIYLLLTVVIESIVLALLMRSWHVKTQVVLLLSNGASWSVLQILWRSFDVNIWLLECLVALFESATLMLVAKLPTRKAFFFSFVNNITSLGIGIIIHGIPQ